MSELERLADQLRRALEGGAWHGRAVLELLADVSADQARSRPVAGGHSIWELVLHLGGTYRLVLRRLRGDATPLAAEQDWSPAPDPTAENWPAAVEGLRGLNAELRRAVAGFDPARLDRPLVADPPYTAYTQFVGLTQHDLYHAGQIALLKRALAGPDPAEVRDLSERWFRAWLEKDAATVDRLAADDYLYVGPTGLALDRAAILAVIRSPTYRLDRGTRTEVVVRAVGRGAAVVRHRYQGAGSFEGTSFTDDHRCVMVWENLAGDWRLVTDQCSFGGQ